MQPSLFVEDLSQPKRKEQDGNQNLFLETVGWLVTLFSDELKIAAEDFETDETFQEYGIDSIILAQLVQQMNQALNGDIDPSILFEYPTIESFANWLISKYDMSAVLHHSVSERQTPAESAMKQEPIPEQRPQQNSHGKTALLAEDIAIIGLTCRFPGAETLEAYWDLIRDGRSAIKPVPHERFGYSGSNYAGIIDEINRFDHKFFMMSENDVRAMDPQALAVLEESLKLWYHAYYTEKEVKGMRAGVYIGAAASTSLIRPVYQKQKIRLWLADKTI